MAHVLDFESEGSNDLSDAMNTARWPSRTRRGVRSPGSGSFGTRHCAAIPRTFAIGSVDWLRGAQLGAEQRSFLRVVLFKVRAFAGDASALRRPLISAGGCSLPLS